MQLVLPPLPFLRRSGGSFLSGRLPGVRFSRELSARETLRLSPKRKLLLRCQEGKVWLTGGNAEATDIVLERGGQFELAAGASAVIEGLCESRIEIQS